MCASLVKAKILQKGHFLKDIFNFFGKLSSFSKMLVSSGDISFSEKSVFCFWKVLIFWWCCFLLQKKKMLIYAKSVSFGVNEWILKYSDVVQTFGVKWEVFLSISILLQKCQFCVKKIEILGEMLTFPLSVHYYWKWSSFCKPWLNFFSKNVTFCVKVYIHWQIV